MNYETIIGLEIHAELLTDSKIFCSCSTSFGAKPNTHVCSVCMGMPGSLPALNKKAVELAIKAGLALNCTISEKIKFDRKNYFYPDLPKAYQISQYDMPLCRNGYIEIDIDNKVKRIGITEIHMEEDAGKLVHGNDGKTFVDYNRCGVGLIEIVTEPDIRSGEEAKLVFEEIKSVLECLDVCDCKMQEGSLRCDVNLSVRPFGCNAFGERTEMKNLNSFSSVKHAVENESNRQIELIEKGGKVLRQTRRWDDLKSQNTMLRTKETLDDYRFFPEPDLAVTDTDKDIVLKIKHTIPELPRAKKLRFIKDYGLPEFDAHLISASKELSDWFEETADLSGEPKKVSNYMVTDIQRLMKEKKMLKIPFEPAELSKLIDMVKGEILSLSASRQVLEAMFESGQSPEDIAVKQNLIQVSDESVLIPVIEQIIADNQSAVSDYKSGKEKAIGFLTGQVMKFTKGSANPMVINKILKEKLSK